jgi:hypothetical protein
VGGRIDIGLGVPGTAAAAPSPTPSSLQSETLDGGNGTAWSGTCDPNGNSTFQFATSGSATGPYSGTFSANGSATFGPGAFQSQPITQFSESFMIKSDTGDVITGTRSGVLQAVSTAGCTSASATGMAVVVPLVTGYKAVIATSAGGRFRDTGASLVVAVGQTQPAAITDNPFNEHFLLSSGVTANTPVSKDQCKDGGWSNYGDDQGQAFKNQGQCVAYVNHL